MRINQSYIGEIFRSRKICSNLKEAGSFTAETDRESKFFVYKEPEISGFNVREVRKGDYGCTVTGNFSEEEFEAEENEPVLKGYPLIDVHFHPSSHGPIVPSIWFDKEGEPDGDLYALREIRTSIREEGYDSKPIMGVAKMRTPTVIDVLLLQEKSDIPHGYGQLARAEDALKPFYESDRKLSPDESYVQALQVADAIRNTGLYSTLILRYRGGRPLKEDLERLVDFEFDEKKLRTLKPA